MTKRWTLEDIPWEKFDKNKVDPETMAIVRAASMVEHNSGDYGAYLSRVFHDDADFQTAAVQWAAEEVQHGRALRRWAELADPAFDFDRVFADFREAYRSEGGFGLPSDLNESSRGSRSRELVYRCVVESGTSSFYSALRDSVEEPVLKEICRNIAADEFRHYTLFYRTLKRYSKSEGLGSLSRLTLAFRCATEYRDDIVAYAYFAANRIAGPYDRKAFGEAYERRATRLYRRTHIERSVKLIFQAAGLNHSGWLARFASRAVYRIMRFRTLRLGYRAYWRARRTDSQERSVAY